MTKPTLKPAPKKKQPKPATVNVTFRIAEEQLAELDELAKREHINRTAALQLAIGKLIKNGI